MRSARSLRDALRRTSNWQVAGDEYAREQSAFYTKVRTVAVWFPEFFLEQGAAADARRAQALPLIAQDGTRVPDLLFSEVIWKAVKGEQSAMPAPRRSAFVAPAKHKDDAE